MVFLILIYLALGAVFALAFFVKGYQKIDSAASDASWFVRIIWVPAALMLWPLLVSKWFQSKNSTN